MTIIIVTGTPGTGKTFIAKLIAKELNSKYVDVNKIIDEKKLCDEYDEVRKCRIVDADKLNNALIDLIKKSKEKSKENLVIDSHMSHYLPKKYVDLCIVTKCSLKILKERLDKRNYQEEKVRENLDAEIFDNCLVQAEENSHNILIVDTTSRIHKEELMKQIKAKLKLT